MTSKPTPAPRPQCNLPGCLETRDLTRGLCPVHWSTHRGLAAEDPKAPATVLADHPEVALP